MALPVAWPTWAIWPRPARCWHGLRPNRPPILRSVRREARIALAEQVGSLGDPVELERRISADPKDHQARLDLAQILNAKGFRDEAADQLLASMKADRAWGDEAARKQLLHFFEAWGPTDAATLSARRKLSALLFS